MRTLMAPVHGQISTLNDRADLRVGRAIAHSADAPERHGWTWAGPTGTMAVPTPPDDPKGAHPDDIFSADTRPVPVVLPARLRPRPPVRNPARDALPRRRPGPRPADRHQLDPCG